MAYNPVQLGSATPLANGTASAGTSLVASRQDHVHPLQTTGNTPFGQPRLLTATATLLATDGWIIIPDTVTTSISLTLPAAPISGQQILIENKSNVNQLVLPSGAGIVILQPNSASTSVSYQQGKNIRLVYAYDGLSAVKNWSAR